LFSAFHEYNTILNGCVDVKDNETAWCLSQPCEDIYTHWTSYKQ